MTGCPEAEDIAAFVAGEPSRALVAHVADCVPCRGLVSALARSAEVDSLAPTIGVPGPETTVDDRIGRYVVLSRLGAGGMGVVYAAYDPELDRKIAVKLLRTQEALARDELHDRLRREAQAMARLAHPNVVAVHDVGSHGEQVFVAMELVEGTTLARWLDGKPGLDAIVAVFRAAGEGLAAAHEAGLVHRDFKPENVLVGRDGRVRVTDFGLARAEGVAEGGLADGGVGELTRTGTVMGTPFYMAPEQYLGGATDARSDQFSFCVALHVAVAGRHPLEIEGPGGLLGAMQEHRLRLASRPGWLRQVLARGLSRRPEERYASMRALLAALERPRVRRWWVGGVIVAAGVGALALGGVRSDRCAGEVARLASVWDAGKASELRQVFLATGKPYAAAAADEVIRVLDGQSAAWGEASCGAPPEQTGCLEDRLRELRALTAHLLVADAELVERAPRLVHALGDVDGCRDETAPLAPASPELRARVAALRDELAEVTALELAGQYPAGCARARALASAAQETQHRPLEAEVQLALGRLERACGDETAAATALERAVWAGEASRHDRVAARAWLALLELHVGGKTRYEDALALEPRLTAALERIGGDVELEAQKDVAIGRVFLDTSRYAEARVRGERALALLEQRFGADDLRVSPAVGLLGDVAYTLGGGDAAPWFERDRAIKERVYGADHPEIARVLRSIARVRHAQGRYQESCDVARQALRISVGAFGGEHRIIASHLNDVASCENAMGHWQAARDVLDRALAIDAATIGTNHVTYAVHLLSLSDTLLGLGLDAVPTMRESLAVFVARLGPEDARTAQAHEYLARALYHDGKFAEASAEAEEALRILAVRGLLDEPYSFRPRLILAKAELARGRHAAAVPLLEKARELARHEGVDPAERAEIDAALAEALVEDGPRARALAEALVEDGPRARALAEALDGDEARARALAEAAWSVLGVDVRRPRATQRLRRLMERMGWRGE